MTDTTINNQNYIDDAFNYEIWDLKIPQIPSRSLLYNLSPIGIGTPDVESLSGYISRLAQEHCLSPFVLLKNSVNESIDKSKLPKTLTQNSISAAFAKSLNGVGKNAKSVVEVLQSATHRKDIYFTTFLPYKRKISNHKLLKKSKTWCSVCYEEDRNNNKIVYEKLIWTVNRADFCSKHELPLSKVCPHCDKKQKILSSKSRPGYCSICLKWLGSTRDIVDDLKKVEDEFDKKTELWKVKMIGELLVESSFFYSINDFSIFIRTLKQLIQNKSNGNINDFAYELGMWHMSIRRLLKKEVLPTIKMILAICQPLKLSASELFTGSLEFKVTQNEKTQTILKRTQKNKAFSKAEMRCYWLTLLKEFPSPSANEVARRTKWTTSRLQRNFPNEYKQIVDNYRNYIEEKLPQISDNEVERILIEALSKTPAPSLQSIFRKIGCRNTGYRYQQMFPELCAKISKRYKKHHNKTFDKQKAKKILKSALQENPTPSFSELARRLKCSRETLNKNFPKLSKLLHGRYEIHLEKSRVENQKEFNKTIKRVLIEMINKEIPISENAIRERLPRKWNDSTFKKSYLKVKKELFL